MVRRRLTIKRLDPWSVLKFGAVANIVLFAILMLVAGVIWYVIDQLRLVDQACGIATDVGFTSCGVNAGNLFRALGLLGAMSVIVQTAVWVFGAFLYNLIADLTGGLVISTVEEGGPARPASTAAGRVATSGAPAGHDERSDGRHPVDGDDRGSSTRSQEPVGGRDRGRDEDLFTDR